VRRALSAYLDNAGYRGLIKHTSRTNGVCQLEGGQVIGIANPGLIQGFSRMKVDRGQAVFGLGAIQPTSDSIT
jgi:hypothetical protein